MDDVHFRINSGYLADAAPCNAMQAGIIVTDSMHVCTY